MRFLPSSCFENFCTQQAGGCAVPDPDRFGEPEIGHAPTLTWWSSNSNIGDEPMAYDQATTYETIELFGLTEKD
ncbi:MAG: hypothetical protein ACSHW6_06685, partial [Sulfitobacter geojensis]